MSIRQLADGATQEILTCLGQDAQKSDDVSRIVEQALAEAVRQTQDGCLEVVNVCCSADQDLAHKIADEVRKKEHALIANLSSLR